VTTGDHPYYGRELGPLAIVGLGQCVSPQPISNARWTTLLNGTLRFIDTSLEQPQIRIVAAAGGR
jgi:hypothetical protein